MAGRDTQWRLEDVVDFEVLVRRRGGPGDEEAERRLFKDELAKLQGGRPGSEVARRRLGLRAWLQATRAGAGDLPGKRIGATLGLVGLGLGVLMFLAGIGVMRGLLERVEIIGRGYNVWIFLGVCLGLQWALLLGGLLGYLVARRQSGALSLVQRTVLWVVRRVSGIPDPKPWPELLEGAAGYQSVLSWRLARLVQGMAIGFNLGLMAGFFGCLWVLKVGFYWESTLAFSGQGLLEFMQWMGWPWEWSGLAPAPRADEIEFALLPKFFFEQAEAGRMWPFLMMSLTVYGLLPRLLLWLLCFGREKGALARIDFQSARHRELWRQLTKVERSLPASGPADGVVIIDVGGIDAPTEQLREFLLRILRVNPRQRYTAEVLDEQGELEALEAIRGADLGVVFLVEGWALSPKQMTALHQRVRAMGGKDVPLHYVVLGELRHGALEAPGTEEWEEWKRFVDSLRDPASEVVAFRQLAPVNDE